MVQERFGQLLLARSAFRAWLDTRAQAIDLRMSGVPGAP
jgi:hypothetical protein